VVKGKRGLGNRLRQKDQGRGGGEGELTKGGTLPEGEGVAPRFRTMTHKGKKERKGGGHIRKALEPETSGEEKEVLFDQKKEKIKGEGGEKNSNNHKLKYS